MVLMTADTNKTSRKKAKPGAYFGIPLALCVIAFLAGGLLIGVAISRESSGGCDLYERHLFPQVDCDVCHAHYFCAALRSHGKAGAVQPAGRRTPVWLDPGGLRCARICVSCLRHDLDPDPHQAAVCRSRRAYPGGGPVASASRTILLHASHRTASGSSAGHRGINRLRGGNHSGSAFRCARPDPGQPSHALVVPEASVVLPADDRLPGDRHSHEVRPQGHVRVRPDDPLGGPGNGELVHHPGHIREARRRSAPGSRSFRTTRRCGPRDSAREDPTKLWR